MNAIIIEDEVIIAKVLQGSIEQVAPDITIQAILPSLKTAKRWFAENPEPDLIFMDVQLSDGVSFEIFNHFQLKCPVIFTTAYDEYAFQAFKNNGIDYLLKPVDETELAKAIQKCKTSNQQQVPPTQDLSTLITAYLNQGNISTYKEKFIVNSRNQSIPISTKDIACFYKENLNYLYHFNGEKYMIDYDSLEEVEKLLDPKLFFRANRQCIIHIEAIAAVKTIEGSKLVVKLKEPNHKLEIDVSRPKSPEFKKWMDR